jgi:hypothetical protein
MGARKPSKEPMVQALEFREGDRTFTCEAATSPATPDSLWWWVSITGESHRYAAFRAQEGDAPANLQPRILAYYAQMVANRERPREAPRHWAQRRPAVKPPETDSSGESPEKS